MRLYREQEIVVSVVLIQLSVVIGRRRAIVSDRTVVCLTQHWEDSGSEHQQIFTHHCFEIIE